MSVQVTGLRERDSIHAQNSSSLRLNLHGPYADYEYDADEFEAEDFDDSDESELMSEDNPDYEFKWLENIDVQVFHTRNLDGESKKERVAYCEVKLIRREKIRNGFFYEIEQPSRETSMLGFDLFDRFGRLRSELKSHPVKGGSGIWGQESDQGDLLLIEQIYVDRAHRRQKLGQRMVQAVIALVRQKTDLFFAFAWPAMLRVRDIEEELDRLGEDTAAGEQPEEREDKIATAFYRSQGFRRVGSSIWSTLASDAGHS